MSVISVGSVRGAPGATTTALLLAGGLGDSLLVEADEAGGVLAVRYGLGRDPGLSTFAAHELDEPSGWRLHAQSAGGVPVLVGPDSPGTSELLWRRAEDRILTALRCSDARNLVIDVGRIATPRRVIAASELLLVVIRPVTEQVLALHHRVSAVRAEAPSTAIGVVTVGSGPHRAVDVAAELDLDLAYELPDEQRVADAFLGPGRPAPPTNRSALGRAINGLCADIATGPIGAGTPTEVAP